MDIYVESRTKKRDYYWLAKREGLPTAEEVPDLPIFQTYPRSSLIDTKTFSVVLFRERSQLLLLITGLPTGRQDTRPRHISNSIAWIGRNADEPILREIAALALNNNLQIPQNVVVELSNGDFKVNWEVIEQLIPSSRATSASPEENSKIARILDQRKQELANEFMEYRLPSGDGALVAVTEGFITHKYYEAIRIWRGLSNDPEVSNEWVVLTPSGFVDSPPPPNPQILRLVVVAGILITIAVSAYFITPHILPPPVSAQTICNGQKMNTNAIQLPFDKKRVSESRANVQQLKEILNELPKGLKKEENNRPVILETNGNFDENTKNAIQDFQTEYNKIVHDPTKKIQNTDGNVDTSTWKALWEKTNDKTTLKDAWDTICENAKPDENVTP